METYQEFINRKNAEFQNTAPKPFKDIGGKGSHGFKREAWSFMVQQNLKEKVFIIERLRRIEINGKTGHSDIKIGDYRIQVWILHNRSDRQSKKQMGLGAVLSYDPSRRF